MTVMTRMASIQVTSMVELRQAQSQASEAELFRLRSLCGCPAHPVSMLKTHATDNPATHHGNELDEFGRLVGRAVSRLHLRFLGMLWVLVTSYNDSPLMAVSLTLCRPMSCGCIVRLHQPERRTYHVIFGGCTSGTYHHLPGPLFAYAFQSFTMPLPHIVFHSSKVEVSQTPPSRFWWM